MSERWSNVIVLLTPPRTGLLIVIYYTISKNRPVVQNGRLLRFSLHRLLVAVEPGTDDGRMTKNGQKTRYFTIIRCLNYISFYWISKLCLNYPKLPKYWIIQSLRGDKYNCPILNQLLRLMKCPFLYHLSMMVQYLTVHTTVHSTQYDWAVMRQYLILLLSRS